MTERLPDSTRADRARAMAERVAAAARGVDGDSRLLRAARTARRLLPGDSEFGDPLSTAGSQQSHVVGRRFADLTAQRPGLMREAGLTALQLWQALAEAQGRGHGDRELAIVFTDLAGFSSWALEAGDDQAVRLLRDVDGVMEPAVRAHRGEVVKRLGDGMMAVFGGAQEALAALEEARAGLAGIECDGYEPRFRAGIHVGRPRKVGGDYLGVDVNIAARVAEQAAPDEVLVSDRALAQLDTASLNVRRKRRFKVKGVPKDLDAHAVSPA